MARALQGGENLLLVGDLGSGKTAFVQGMAEGLGIAEPIKSPTYTYLREYQIPLRSTRLAHFDVYRLPDQPALPELLTIELPERLADPDVITVIEWGERVATHVPGALRIEFADTGDGHRTIAFPKTLPVESP